MIKEHLDRLAELTKTVSTEHQARAGNRMPGRYSKTPAFQIPSVAGTRPSSSHGVTFHFKHSFISKNNSVSGGLGDETSAPSHQSYIERRGASELVQRESDEQGTLISFGNIGSTKAERTEFWRKVERSETKNARVQARMIVELPHEVSGTAREQIAREFCRELDVRGFPFWCVVHAPGDKNDARNYHMHIAYYDRPSKRLAGGLWDFEVTEEKKYANRSKRVIRPLRQKKDREAQGPQWIKMLRQKYAATANMQLEKAGALKRYDYRPYRESGIEKAPTIHLGTRAAVAESKGLDTRVGEENSRREASFRLAAGISGLEQRRDAAAALSLALSALDPDNFSHRRLKTVAIQSLKNFEELSSRAIELMTSRNRSGVAGDIIGRRLILRSMFLDAESERLIIRPPRGRDLSSSDTAISMINEKISVDSVISEAEPFLTLCVANVAKKGREIAKIMVAQDGLAASIKPILDLLERDEFSDTTFRNRATWAVAKSFQETFDKTSVVIRDTVLPVSGGRPLQIPSLDKSAAHRPFGEAEKSVDEANRDVLDLIHEEDKTARPTVVGGSTSSGGFSSEIRVNAEDEADEDKLILTDDLPTALSKKEPAVAHTDRPVSLEDKAAQTLLGKGGRASRSDRASYSDAMFIHPTKDTSEDSRLDSTLEQFRNAELRYHIFATRDSVDLTENEEERMGFERALRIAEAHAIKRGLDVETGIHRRSKGTDKRLASMHGDSAVIIRRKPDFQKIK